MSPIKDKLIFQLVINYKDGQCENRQSDIIQGPHKKFPPSRNKSECKVETIHSPSAHAQKVPQRQQIKSIK
jgi:hypothetical protein